MHMSKNSNYNLKYRDECDKILTVIADRKDRRGFKSKLAGAARTNAARINPHLCCRGGKVNGSRSVAWM